MITAYRVPFIRNKKLAGAAALPNNGKRTNSRETFFQLGALATLLDIKNVRTSRCFTADFFSSDKHQTITVTIIIICLEFLPNKKNNKYVFLNYLTYFSDFYKANTLTNYLLFLIFLKTQSTFFICNFIVVELSPF